jgi:uncharacterized protein DUF6188
MLPVMVTDMDAGMRPRPERPGADLLPGLLTGLLVGQKLEFLRLGHAVVLGFSGGSQVLIETLARLDGPDGRVFVEPGDEPSDDFATLLGDTIRSVRSYPRGELEITFASGAELLVGVDPDVESWAVAGPRGVLLVCLARGEIAVWGDPR